MLLAGRQECVLNKLRKYIQIYGGLHARLRQL